MLENEDDDNTGKIFIWIDTGKYYTCLTLFSASSLVYLLKENENRKIKLISFFQYKAVIYNIIYQNSGLNESSSTICHGILDSLIGFIIFRNKCFWKCISEFRKKSSIKKTM